MKWFKHWNEASQGDTLKQFLVTRDYECYALFWVLCELMSRMGKDGFMSVKLSFLAHEMGMKPTKARRVLARFVSVSHSWNWSETGEICAFHCSNWATFNDSRAKLPGRISLESPGEEEKRRRVEEEKKEVEDRELKKALPFSPPEPAQAGPSGSLPIFADDPDVVATLKGVTHSAQKLWLKTYPDPVWLHNEVLKAKTWLELNPQRRPKGANLGRFLGRWFSRGWEQHRKTLQSVGQSRAIAPDEGQRLREIFERQGA